MGRSVNEHMREDQEYAALVMELASVGVMSSYHTGLKGIKIKGNGKVTLPAAKKIVRDKRGSRK